MEQQKNIKKEVISKGLYSDYIESHRARFIEELSGWLSIASVSADSAFAPQMDEAARYIEHRLREAGVDDVRLISTEGQKVVYAEKRVEDSAAPTILVYGHYDVQPADPYSLWETPPFSPTLRNGRLYARGACDDKGQVYMYIKVLEMMGSLGRLGCNVKFFIEGEEEVGSPSAGSFLRKYKDLLSCDALVISDTALLSKELPSLTVGIRGISYFELHLRSTSRDLHSGEYGGAVANPIQALCGILSRMKDGRGRVCIPHFYDKVLPLSSEEKAMLSRVPFDANAYKESIGAKDLYGEEGYSTYERVGSRPTFEINGIYGGYTGRGAKTVLPSRASAKVSMRLVPNQQPEEVAESFRRYFLSLVPKNMEAEVVPHHHGRGVYISPTSLTYRAASVAMEEVWGKRPVPMRMGGSIPIVPLLEEQLGVTPLLMGFGLPEDALHAPNESFDMECFTKGIHTIARFLEQWTAYAMEGKKE